VNARSEVSSRVPRPAPADTIRSRLPEAEVIHPKRAWHSHDEVELATLERVDWFNRRRLLETIGHLPPAEFEAMYYAKRWSTIIVIGLN
jgi:transposase InsO family protein